MVAVASFVALGSQTVPAFAAPGPACALALAFYTFGTRARGRAAVAIGAGCVALVGCAFAGPIVFAGPPADSSLVLASMFAGLAAASAATLGFAIGERRAQDARRHEQMLRQAAAEQRLMLSRDLHDIIAHTMTLIVVKASIGNHVAEASPAEARDALRVIETTGRAAMYEVRKVLGMLRADTPYAPAPGLDDLQELASQASTGGASVTLDVDHRAGSAPGRMPDSVGLAVYRIVQEAITNVVKHAAPAHCHVSVVVDTDEVRVDVNDDGKRRPVAAGTGYGLTGMRERVALYGGTFSAGPRTGGGFAVTARLPVGGGGG